MKTIRLSDGTRVVFSTTAYQTGFGTARYKHVCGLTPDERRAARAGIVVIYDSGRPQYGSGGTTLRMVRCRWRYLDPVALDYTPYGMFDRVECRRFKQRVLEAMANYRAKLDVSASA